MPLPDVKTLIRRVVKVFKKECETKRPIICFAKPMQRVVKTLGISRNQISKVMDSDGSDYPPVPIFTLSLTHGQILTHGLNAWRKEGI